MKTQLVWQNSQNSYTKQLFRIASLFASPINSPKLDLEPNDVNLTVVTLSRPATLG